LGKEITNRWITYGVMQKAGTDVSVVSTHQNNEKVHMNMGLEKLFFSFFEISVASYIHCFPSAFRMPGREAKPREEEGCNSCHSTL
jgi:hypothetical protein